MEHKEKREAPESRKEEPKSNMWVAVLFLLLVAGFYVYTLIVQPRTGITAEDENKYLMYKGELVPLRATVGECKSVPIRPSPKEVARTLANSNKITLLVDPYSEDKYYAVNLAQINLIAKSQYLNKPITYAYTREYENSTEIIEPDVLGLDYGNANHVAILMNRTGVTSVTMEKEGQIVINANESKDYNRAVCALELSVLGIV